MKTFAGIMIVAAALAFAGVAFAQTAPATTTSKPATPACCGDKCQKMGDGCCRTDAAGKTTCGMGGTCCEKK